MVKMSVESRRESLARRSFPTRAKEVQITGIADRVPAT